MLRLTNTQLLNRLHELSDSTFVSLKAVVKPDMRKTGNPYHGKVLKVVIATGCLNFRYSRVVNRQKKRESLPENFKAKERQWGEKLPHCPLVKHVGGDGQTRYYLDIKVQGRVEQYRDIETGQMIARDRIAPWLRNQTTHRQGVRYPIIQRDFRITNIVELRILGEVWEVRSGAAKLERLLKGTKK